jgi:hypothetical protein
MTMAAAGTTREREGEGERWGDHSDDDEQARGEKEETTPHHHPPASRATARGVDSGWNDDMEGMGTTTKGDREQGMTMGTRMTTTMDGDMMRQQAEGDAMMGQLLLSRFCILVV